MTESAERIAITGVVQGVGFRPFVYRAANRLGIRGRVYNDASDVIIEAAGTASSVDELAALLGSAPPPLARLATVERQRISADEVAGSAFVIAGSRNELRRTVVPPDAATCDQCLSEMADPSNRRHRHPFITCTDCGPRFTIISGLPYDRAATTMADFVMCEECRREYEDPHDRRHHAQPISCHGCGPRLRVECDGDLVGRGEQAIDCAVDALSRGRIVAVKGIGGFHLACDATQDDAVAVLRQRKGRPHKPFAVMVSDLEAARELAHVGQREAEELESSARPIVLMRSRSAGVSALVAPENPLIGVVLAYSPVHHLLLERAPSRLVMTSANVGGEPIAFADDAGTERRLRDLADLVLTHDRPIVAPCDDSVVRLVDGAVVALRRARGHAPLPIVAAGQGQILATGSDLKNTFCLADDGHYWLSQHIGDMGAPATLESFEDGVGRFSRMYSVAPTDVVADRHPGYVTRRWARAEEQLEFSDVQHHHAHVASVMAEHGLDPDAEVVGFAFDGTGYGDDGTIWGGEVLVADATVARRVAHLKPVSLPGGDVVVEQPCRAALAHLRAAGVDWSRAFAPAACFDSAELTLLERQLERGVACTTTSSMGRLFDAVASLLDLRHYVTFEAHAAADLEIAAADADAEDMPGYRFAVEGSAIDPAPVVRSIVEDLAAGLSTAVVARRFHEAVVDVIVGLASDLSSRNELAAVVLSGGVFQNALLVRRCFERLGALDIAVLMNRAVPPNDGGLALGQAFIASNRHLRKESC